MGGVRWDITKNRINLELIEIIQFCLKMETIWGQHEGNVETTWGQCGGPQGCGDHYVKTTWGQCGDNMRTMWGPWGCGDHVGTTWRQHGDNVGPQGC